MHPGPVTDLKTFVPAKDAELSKKFYTDLGFTINWSNEQIAELQIGSFRFLLQTFYVAEHAGNFIHALRGAQGLDRGAGDFAVAQFCDAKLSVRLRGDLRQMRYAHDLRAFP